jgi:hypothetical protein
MRVPLACINAQISKTFVKWIIWDFVKDNNLDIVAINPSKVIGLV